MEKNGIPKKEIRFGKKGKPHVIIVIYYTTQSYNLTSYTPLDNPFCSLFNSTLFYFLLFEGFCTFDFVHFSNSISSPIQIAQQ
jgi:hypothetical protein